jgi:glyoxylase-like metal-dependent hydrolase (beta-lactamase superfamily II)
LKSLQIVSRTQGPAATNAYLVADAKTASAVAIDPAWDGEELLRLAEDRAWRITQIWLTHAHFDHLGGAAALSDGSPHPLPVALHPSDHPLWKASGGAAFFGFGAFDPGPEPTLDLFHEQILHLGPHEFKVLHTPGHTPGHVAFLQEEARVLFCGDLIFAGSVGRVDLPGGDGGVLLDSIQQHVLNLPDEFRLLPGHGPETRVGRERVSNPFLAGLSS